MWRQKTKTHAIIKLAYCYGKNFKTIKMSCDYVKKVNPTSVTFGSVDITINNSYIMD